MDILVCASLAIGEAYFNIAVRHPTTGSLVLTFFALFIFQYTAVKLYRIFIYPNFLSPLRHIPGPKDGHIFIGQVYKLYKSLPAQLQLSWMRQLPDEPLIRYLSFGNSEVVLLNSPQAHREVFQTHCYSFQKPAFHARVVGDIAGRGLLFAEGEEHKKQRRLLVGPFNFGNIKNLLPFFSQKAAELCSIMSRTIGKDDSSVMEVTSLISKVTLDIISLAALGYNSDSLSSRSIFAESYKTVFELSTLGQIIAVIHAFIPLRSWLPLRANRDFVKANADIRQTLREQIRQRKTQIEEKGKTAESVQKSRDLLTLMIEERTGGVDSWTDDEMLEHVSNISKWLKNMADINQLLNFMAAGHETTAGALTWTLRSLTIYPDMQVRLRNEIESVIPRSRAPTYAEIESLHFLHNLTREVLRYYPPAVSVPREAATDVTICNTLIPKGTLIMVVPAVSHFNEKIWGQTASQFDPDRWDNLPEAALDPFASQSFITGPRICIGKAFALLEYKAILIELVRNFRFEATSDKVELIRGGVTLRPVGGLKLRVANVERTGTN